MKKLIELPDDILDNLEKEAKQEKRTLKLHLEYILIMHSKQRK